MIMTVTECVKSKGEIDSFDFLLGKRVKSLSKRHEDNFGTITKVYENNNDPVIVISWDLPENPCEKSVYSRCSACHPDSLGARSSIVYVYDCDNQLVE